jgi:hypothetical protein
LIFQTPIMYLFFPTFKAAQAALQTINDNMGIAPGDVNAWATVMECRAGWYFPKPEDNFMFGLHNMDVRDTIELSPENTVI